MKKKIAIYIIITSNVVSIFFNFRWAFKYSVSTAIYHFTHSYQSLIFSTLLSSVSLFLLYQSERIVVEEKCLDSEFMASKASKKLFILSILFAVIGCTLPEVIDFF